MARSTTAAQASTTDTVIPNLGLTLRSTCTPGDESAFRLVDTSGATGYDVHGLYYPSGNGTFLHTSGVSLVITQFTTGLAEQYAARSDPFGVGAETFQANLTGNGSFSGTFLVVRATHSVSISVGLEQGDNACSAQAQATPA